VQRGAKQASQDEREDAPHAAPDRGEEESRGNDERRVIHADHRMAQPREEALRERLRQLLAHEVVGPGEAREQQQCRQRERQQLGFPANSGLHLAYLHTASAGRQSSVNTGEAQRRLTCRSRGFPQAR
jgi:MarR-like DNA-binding transcriptional regulator SgrR of sgrS sRNA